MTIITAPEHIEATKHDKDRGIGDLTGLFTEQLLMDSQPWEDLYKRASDVQSITTSAEARLTSSRPFSCVCFGNQITVIFNIRPG